MPKLIPDFRLAWRFLSVQAALLLSVLSGIQADVLPLVQPLVPADKWPWVSGGLALAIIVLRVLDQPGLEPGREQVQQDAQAYRRQLQVDELDASDIHEDWEQAMPAGRLERYIGAVAGLVIVAFVLSLVGLVWSLVQ